MSVLSRVSSLLLRPCWRPTHQHTLIRGFKKKQPFVRQKPNPKAIDGIQFTKGSKYVLYTVMVVPASFVGAVIWQYENVKQKVREKLKKPIQQRQRKEGNLRDHINVIWNSMSDCKKVTIGLISVNIAVFLLWRVPPLHPVLSRYFSCSPTKGHSIIASTLSGFSHQGPIHLFINMYVLWNFAEFLSMIGKEQLIATYIGAATFSGMVSSLNKIAIKAISPSVGASGAIMSFLTLVCMTYPDMKLQIAFIGDIVPHSFSASTGLLFLVLIDTTGVLLRWKYLDHGGHLGGIIFGMTMYYLAKSGYIREAKVKVLDTWHRFRK